MKIIPLPTKFHAGIDKGKLVAHEFVSFLVNECGAVNTTGKPLYNTAVKDLLIEGRAITRCEIDTFKYKAHFTLA